MKKIFFGLISAILLLVSCNNDENTNGSNDNRTGELMLGKITFAGVNGNTRSSRAAESTAIPVTNWGNVNQVQLFLYEVSGSNAGKIAFSYIIEPSENGQEFTWANIPTGNYRLALVANIKSSSDPVSTSVSGSLAEFGPYNVKDLLVNTNASGGIYVDLKTSSLPASHLFEVGKVGYHVPSEIFTAYSDITITEGVKTTVTGMQLKREVSLMRVRVDRSESFLNDVVFDDSDLSGIFVHRLPVGFKFPVGATAGDFTGGGSSSSDIDRIMIAKTGANTFRKANPDETTHKNPTILTGNFTLWQEFCVLPNQVHGLGLGANDPDVDSSRKYFIVLSAKVPMGYEYADGTIAEEEDNAVYWSSTINKAFVENIIREVNITVSSKGYPENPKEPKPEGGLEITVSAPAEWNDNIQVENLEV